MNQLAIDFHARRTDPTTSHKAAERVSKFADGHYKLILAALNLKDGLTPREIAELSGLDYHAVQRRMKELADGGQIIADGVRDNCRVWWLA